MKKTVDKLISILAEWNPIEVPNHIADDEYKSYIPLILKSIHNRIELKNCLEDILINKMEIGYDASNSKHNEDLQQVCDKLIKAKNESLRN